MRHTETPALRLTKSCIANSFKASGLRHVFITGGRQSGKTTLINKLADGIPGITTFARQKDGVYFCNDAGQTAKIGEYDGTVLTAENRMRPIEDAFLSFAVPAVERLIDSEYPRVKIDEIGYLEQSCPQYADALERLFAKKSVIASVRKQNIPLLDRLISRDDAFVIDMDRPFGDYACVIMASGRSKRFGSNKLVADFNGRPMITRTLDATDGLFCERIAVTRYDDVCALCGEYGVQAALHSLPDRNDTVRIGLESIRKDVSGCMFCQADQPLLKNETVAALLLCAVNGSKYIWRTKCGDDAGAPVVFPKSMFGELKELPAGAGGGHLIRKYAERVRYLNVFDPLELKDADTPEELNILAKSAEKY